MGKIKRGGYTFITWKGDHGPRHVHVFRDARLSGMPDFQGCQTYCEMGSGAGQADFRIIECNNMETDRRAPGGTASVTVQSIRANNHKRCFELETEKGPYTFPYALLPNDIRDEDKVQNVYPDPDIGFAGFEYVLDSGSLDTVHLDSVLWYNADPRYLYDLFLYQLTTAAVDALQDTKLGKRQLIRRLGTSSSQFYRILDTTNYAKSPEQLIALLHILGNEVKFSIVPRTDKAWEELSKSQARPRRRHTTSRS